MTSINKIAKSSISRSTARITTASFNECLHLLEADANIVEDYYKVSDPEGVLAIAGMTTLSPAYLAAAAFFGGDIVPDTLIIGQKLASDADHAAALVRIFNAGAKPYFVTAETRVFAEQQAMNTYLSTKGKNFVAVSNLPADIVEANDSSAEVMNSDRCLYLYEEADTYNDLRVVSYMAAREPGSWALDSTKLQNAVKLDITDTEYDEALANRMNFFTDFGGNIVLQDGKTSGGEWIDVMVSLDWVNARIEEELALLKIKLDRVEYTEKGIGLERAAIMSVLGRAQDMGIFSTWELTSESAESQGSTIRGTREYKGHKWTATIIGSIKYTEVSGNVGA